MAKKQQVLLSEVPASAHPVETLRVARLCRINSVGLMPTAKQNPSEKEPQYWLLWSLKDTAILVPSRVETGYQLLAIKIDNMRTESAGEFQLLTPCVLAYTNSSYEVIEIKSKDAEEGLGAGIWLEPSYTVVINYEHLIWCTDTTKALGRAGLKGSVCSRCFRNCPVLATCSCCCPPEY